MKKIIWIFVFILVICPAVTADPNDPNELIRAKWQGPIKDPNNPNELIQVKWDAVVKVLQSDMDPNSKADTIDIIVSPLFDFSIMSKLAMGRAHWPLLTDKQANEYTKLFVQHLKKTYRDKVTLYENEKTTIGPAVKNGTTVQIPMKLKNDETEVTVLYKMHRPMNKWKIYDVEIQGVSIILTYRSQFKDILSHGSLEDVLAHLKKPVKP